MIRARQGIVQASSHGPESRGGRCKSEMIISGEDIDFPKVGHPGILIMSQETCMGYVNDLKGKRCNLGGPWLVSESEKGLKS